MSNGVTPTQKKMLEVLADGLPHADLELHACLPDDLGAMSNIRAHLAALRKALRPKGQDVSCERLGGRTYYKHVGLTTSPNSD